MSFNEITSFRTALSRLTKDHPSLVKGGHRSVMWVIVSYPDGCFIGQQELADQSGYALDTVKTYLRDLSALGFILREQRYARKGLRQCYRVDVIAMTNFNRVLSDTPYKPGSTAIGVAQSPKSVTESVNEYDLSPPYRYYKNNKYDKDRFSDFKLLLLPNLQSIEPGHKVEAALEELVSKGCTLQVPATLLNNHDFTGARSVSEVAVKLLIEFSNSYAPTPQPPAYVAELVKRNPPQAGSLDELRKKIGTGVTRPI